MKIKQLDITGFKSFAEKTTVLFSQGICAVVGPNGCGKSNIVDAIRWVMGEQSVKHLRGKSMEDVIFSGTEIKPPLNMAEVALTLINDNGNTPEEYRHFSEIMVSRRLFRSGESGYYINKQACRLKDIQNLLMGTGVGSRTYAIIEQGRIESLIDAGPERRRYFIEEAAGITRYKARKNEALQKINRTQQNLLRINDVIFEVRRQINSLKRQAKKAERFKTYQQKIQDLEVTLAAYRYRAICAEMAEAGSLLESLRDTDLKNESEFATLDAAIEQIKQQRAAKHESISEHKAKRHQLERAIDRLEGDIHHGAKDIERMATEADQLRTDIQGIAEKDQGITVECVTLERKKETLLQDTEKIKETLKQEQQAEQTARQRLAELRQSLEDNKPRLIELASRKATYANTLQNTSKQGASLSTRLDQIKKEKNQTASEHARLEKVVAKAESHDQTLTQALQQIDKALESLHKQLLKKREALGQQVRSVQSMDAERQKISSRHGALKKMQDNYEWFKKGVRVIMKQWNPPSAGEDVIIGLVADVIEPEPSYEEAVEAALGQTLQHVIVRDQNHSVAAIDFLRSQSAGRGSFIAKTAFRPLIDPNNTVFPEGHEPLINHIRVKKGYEELIHGLLSHVVVAEDLESALKHWNHNTSPCVIVTRKGEQLCPQGILTGGSADNGDSGILAKKKEVRDLADKISLLEASFKQARAKQQQLETETIALETQLQKGRETQRQKGLEQIQIEKELYRLREQLKHSSQHLEILALETRQIEGEQTDVQQELSSHQKVLSELALEIQAVELAIGETNGKIEQASTNMDAVSQKVVELKLELANLQARSDNCQNTLRRLRDFQSDSLTRLNQLEKELNQREQDRTATENRLAKDRATLSGMYDELKSMEETLAEGEAGYEAIENMLQENDKALSHVRSAQQETLLKIQQLELKQSERHMKHDHLKNRILDTYHRNIETCHQDYDFEGFSVEQAEEQLTQFHERMSRIGEVNLTAIQDYETLSERYELLTSQRDDLMNATDALRRVIRKINRTSLKQFMKTFKAVNEKLQMVFPRLFEGGTASLALMEPRKPLESGIAYLVHPPGKKLTHMSLLSGGEKALAAIGLVFSLFLIKPTAFCVLDEIDAPLDDVNILRFSSLVKEIGEASQVIMITHNRQTMEMADALFGVTMEDKGVSKLLSLSLDGLAKSPN